MGSLCLSPLKSQAESGVHLLRVGDSCELSSSYFIPSVFKGFSLGTLVFLPFQNQHSGLTFGHLAVDLHLDF